MVQLAGLFLSSSQSSHQPLRWVLCYFVFIKQSECRAMHEQWCRSLTICSRRGRRARARWLSWWCRSMAPGVWSWWMSNLQQSSTSWRPANAQHTKCTHKFSKHNIKSWTCSVWTNYNCPTGHSHQITFYSSLPLRKAEVCWLGHLQQLH